METRTRSERSLLAPAALAVAAAGSVAAVLARDPHLEGRWGTCTILGLTGWYCPGCGGLRAVHDLANGRVVDALSANALVVIVVGLLAFGWFRWVRARLAGRPLVISGVKDSWVLLIVFGGLIVFTVGRNTPMLAALAP